MAKVSNSESLATILMNLKKYSEFTELQLLNCPTIMRPSFDQVSRIQKKIVNFLLMINLYITEY